MKLKFVSIRVILICFLLSVFNENINAQNETWETEEDSTRFFIGFNLGAHFPNNNTALMYSGRPDVTPYGINYILSQPYYQQIFDEYFVYPYWVAEFPFAPAYKNSFEIGVQLAYKLNEEVSIFLGLNSVQLEYEQFFTVAIDNPYNQKPGPTYEQYPVIGEEDRFYLNLGTHLSFFNGESSKAYFSFFANLNKVGISENFIVIDGVEYRIYHYPEYSNKRPGGFSYGGGTGLGFKFEVADRIYADLYYDLYYASIKMNENIHPFGLHHSIGLRIIWGMGGNKE